MPYLLEVTETYRVDTEPEVDLLIEKAKADSIYSLIKYNRTYKEKKQKGVVIESWYKVTLTKRFCDEKEPDTHITISYERE